MANDAALQRYAREVKELEAQIEALDKKRNKRRKMIVREMERRKRTGLEWKSDTELIRIAYVAPEPVTYHPDRAKKQLPEEVYAEITVDVIDKKKLEQAIAAGLLTAAEAAKFSEIGKSTPYPRITIK